MLENDSSADVKWASGTIVSIKKLVRRSNGPWSLTCPARRWENKKGRLWTRTEIVGEGDKGAGPPITTPKYIKKEKPVT